MLAAAFLYLEPQIPDARTYRDLRPETPLRVLAAHGEMMAEFGTRRSIPVPLAQMPKTFVAAVLDTEDKRFYEHPGVDPFTLAKSFLELVVRGEITRGGSTITMQLARNISLSLERKFIRKFKEILLALKLERELSKDEILEMYLNVIPFGKRAYGAEAAAWTYYGKPLSELNIAQWAMLAGIPQRPEANNPINGPKAALARRNLVLARMLEMGSISEDEYREARAAPITAGVHTRPTEVHAPYVAEWVRSILLQERGRSIYTDGLEVTTTIDARLQHAANAALRRGLLAYDRRHGYRGVEGHTPFTNPARDEETEAGAADREEISAYLTGIPVYSGLYPAIVRDLTDTSMEVMLADARTIAIEPGGWRWARPYIDANTRGPVPSRPSDVVQIGDLVRVEQTDQGWRLAELPAIQGSLISLDPDTGAIDALVGGFDFDMLQYNHAIQAKRQPGSGIKPFIYAAALHNGYTASSLFLDAPLVFEDKSLEGTYRPRNSSGKFRGPTRLREALYRSINLVTMRVLLAVGPDKVLDYLPRFGFDTRTFPRDLQLAVGGGTIGVTPLTMAGAYAVLANGGYRVEPHIITRVARNDGVIIDEPSYPRVCESCQHIQLASREPGLPAVSNPDDDAADPPLPLHTAERVVDARDVYILNSMLRDVIRRGTGRRARSLGRRDLAGKTGTTNDADVWFNGFNRHRVTTVWIGFSDNAPLGDNEFGSNGPLPVWIEFMKTALADQPEAYLPEPNGLVRVRIDPHTGRRAPAGAPGAEFELFREENAPPPLATETREQQDRTVDPYDIF